MFTVKLPSSPLFKTSVMGVKIGWQDSTSTVKNQVSPLVPCNSHDCQAFEGVCVNKRPIDCCVQVQEVEALVLLRSGFLYADGFGDGRGLGFLLSFGVPSSPDPLVS